MLPRLSTPTSTFLWLTTLSVSALNVLAPDSRNNAAPPVVPEVVGATLVVTTLGEKFCIKAVNNQIVPDRESIKTITYEGRAYRLECRKL